MFFEMNHAETDRHDEPYTSSFDAHRVRNAQ